MIIQIYHISMHIYIYAHTHVFTYVHHSSELSSAHQLQSLGSSHDGWEDRARRIVPGEAGLAHAAAVVHHQCLR